MGTGLNFRNHAPPESASRWRKFLPVPIFYLTVTPKSSFIDGEKVESIYQRVLTRRPDPLEIDERLQTALGGEQAREKAWRRLPHAVLRHRLLIEN